MNLKNIDRIITVLVMLLVIVMAALYLTEKESYFDLCRNYCKDLYKSQARSDGSYCQCIETINKTLIKTPISSPSNFPFNISIKD